MYRLTTLQGEIIKVLKETGATYRAPLSSYALAERLNITASYIRQNIIKLKKIKYVGVRRGSGGGFFLRGDYHYENIH